MKVVINNKEFDSHICKYSPINDNLYESLRNNYLWFSDPANFNDPYDLNLNLIVPQYSKEQLTKFAKELIEAGRGQGRTIDAIVSHYMTHPKSLKDAMQQRVDKFASETGICCFSQTEDILLMWSHYADKHMGVCMKFDMGKDQLFFTTPIKMDYPAVYPHFDFLQLRKDDGALVQLLVGTKSIDWKYENEIRIAKGMGQDDKFRGQITFGKCSLIEVIFGYKTQPKMVTEIKSLLILMGYNCTFYKMALKKEAFGLVKELVT